MKIEDRIVKQLIAVLKERDESRQAAHRSAIWKMFEDQEPYTEEDMKPKRRVKIEFKKTKAGAQKGEWRYTIKAANGEKLVTSEGHGSKRDAQRGLDTLIALLTSK